MFRILQGFVMEHHASMTWWLKLFFSYKIMHLTSGGRCNHFFWDIRLKILRLPYFNMLFQHMLTKFFKNELFSCLLKVDHMIKSWREPNYLKHLENYFEWIIFYLATFHATQLWQSKLCAYGVAILCYLRLPDTFSMGPWVTHMQVW